MITHGMPRSRVSSMGRTSALKSFGPSTTASTFCASASRTAWICFSRSVSTSGPFQRISTPYFSPACCAPCRTTSHHMLMVPFGITAITRRGFRSKAHPCRTFFATPKANNTADTASNAP